jgi:hypothetical protein
MSDGRFSSKPIRSAKRSEYTANASFGQGEYSAEANISADAVRAFLASPAVQREADRLMDELFPAVASLACAPFPKNTPEHALDLGRRIASAVLAQEYLIGLVFLRAAGWLFLVVGSLLLMVGVGGLVVMFFEPQRPNVGGNERLGMIGCFVFGMGVTGAGLWFGYFRGRVINEMCWFCPRGMVWMSENHFDSYSWDEVPEVFCRLQAPRPAAGIRFDGDTCWISFSNTHESRLIVQYIENRASAASARETLKSIAEGRTIHFGDWSLSRSAIDRVDWRDVIAIDVDDRELVIHRRDRDEVAIHLDAIPYPSLFIAAARAAHAYARDQKP